MTDEKAIQGEANVAKYMALLDSESDLKNKLQQFYLKKVEDDKIKDDEIQRLQDLLRDKESQLSELEAKEAEASGGEDLEALSNNLKINTIKLNQCRAAYYDLEEKLKKKDEQLAESSLEIDSLKNQLTSGKKVGTKKRKTASSKKTSTVKTKQQADDLTRIKGVGPKIKSKLVDAGISTFEQIATWKKSDIASFEKELNFKGRIQRDSWVKQAKKLAKEK